MLSQYGLKIKNFSCGILYEYNLGVREHLTYTNAMFTNNLLSYYLVENGLKVSKDGRTRDIICINFDFGSKSYEETKKKLERSIEKQKASMKVKGDGQERLDRLYELLDYANKDFIKLSSIMSDVINKLNKFINNITHNGTLPNEEMLYSEVN